MIWSALGNHLPQSGNPLVVHGHARALRVSAAIAATLLLAPPARYTVVAQTSPAPAVRVLRDFSIAQRVWPVDLNRDGITDLASSSPTRFVNGVATGGELQVSTGKGDGTFNAPVQTSTKGVAFGAADFNGDGNPDVIAVLPAPNFRQSIAILPGQRHRHAWRPCGSSATASTTSFVLAADINGDGKRDLITQGGDGIAVYPGNGDFTFGIPATFSDFNAPIEGIVADFNGDGRRDLAIANLANSVSIFLNQGSLLFTAADVALSRAWCPMSPPLTSTVMAGRIYWCRAGATREF